MKMSKNLYMEKIGKKAKLASLHLSNVNNKKRNSALKQFSQYLKTNTQIILKANKKDVSNAKSKILKITWLIDSNWAIKKFYKLEIQ